MVKKNAAGALLCIMLLAAGYGYCFYNRHHMDVSEKNIDFNLTAQQAFDEFNLNENSSNKKYLNKVLKITGQVNSIEITNNNEIIQLNANELGGVSCLFSKKNISLLSGLKKGNTVVVKGLCTGFLMDVNLVDCVMEK